jgi:outer membrane protein insertion porin family
MSTGGEISVVVPVINAPFRLYYAYNPLRLSERPYCNLGIGKNKQSCSAELITQSMFPNDSAGIYTYTEVTSAYGAQNIFREPSKTFRLTVSTTF